MAPLKPWDDLHLAEDTDSRGARTVTARKQETGTARSDTRPTGGREGQGMDWFSLAPQSLNRYLIVTGAFIATGGWKQSENEGQRKVGLTGARHLAERQRSEIELSPGSISHDRSKFTDDCFS